MEKEDERGVVDRFYVDCDHISCVGRRNIWVSLLLIHSDINILYSRAILTWSVDQTEGKKKKKRNNTLNVNIFQNNKIFIFFFIKSLELNFLT